MNFGINRPENTKTLELKPEDAYCVADKVLPNDRDDDAMENQSWYREN